MTIITPELLSDYFKKKKESLACKEAEKLYAELRLHANGEKPLKLLEKQRPSEPREVMKYRLEIFEAITQETFSRILSSAGKIRRSPDWSIKFDPSKVPAKIVEKETPEQYFTYHFPKFQSITNWTFQVLLRQYLIDVNAVCVVMPINPNVANNEYLRPYPYIFNSDMVKEFIDEDYCVIEALPTAKYAVAAGVYKYDGKVFWVINGEFIRKYEQSSSDGTMTVTVDYLHALGYMPAFRLGGLFKKEIGDSTIYESRIKAIVPQLNKAIREDNDLDVSVVRHLFPEKWEYVTMDCPKCNGNSKIINGAGESVTCTQCGGFGKLVSSPFQTHQIKAPGLDQQPIPTPPAGYIVKDIEIIKVMQQRIEKHIFDALASINMEFLAKVPVSESGIAKQFDREESNNTMHYIAEDIVRIMDIVVKVSTDYRYMTVVPDYEQRKELLPIINVPSSFDFVNNNMLMAEYAAAKQAKLNPIMITKMEEEIASKRFSNDPETMKELVCILRLDPMAGMSTDDKVMFFQNGWVTKQDAVISANIVSFVRDAIIDNPDFTNLPQEEQETIMEDMANEKIVEMSAASAVKKMIADPPAEGAAA